MLGVTADEDRKTNRPQHLPPFSHNIPLPPQTTFSLHAQSMAFRTDYTL